ncbi:MAG: indole-3-glycerol-phosphate synthase [Candidatus Micrarchaeota archaeon]|nr:indole-3-glycerol-phosphate synthase [Candidatus Micrarchaeota archaeon]
MDILDRFITQAKENVASGYYSITDVVVATEEKISLKDTLNSKNFSLISEIKHASPAGEYSFDNINVEKTATVFRNYGADAISVVVEPKIFRGDLKHIPIAKKAGLPIVFKDFVLDERQINAASAYGADCILLVMKVIDRLNLNVDKLITLAHKNNLEVLLECYDNEEMLRATKTNADILGINNRDLQTLKVDLKRTTNIMNNLKELNKPVISESGIKTREDAEFVKASGVKGILVGTALWTANDQAAKIKELTLK